MTENPIPLDQQIQTVIVPPTPAEIQRHKDARRQDPRLPENPPLQMGVALPLPPTEKQPSIMLVPRRLPKILEEQPLTPAQKLEAQRDREWHNFEVNYRYKEPTTPQEKEVFEKLRHEAREKAQQMASRLLDDGSLTPENSAKWIEVRMTALAEERVRVNAFNQYLAEKDR